MRLTVHFWVQQKRRRRRLWRVQILVIRTLSVKGFFACVADLPPVAVVVVVTTQKPRPWQAHPHSMMIRAHRLRKNILCKTMPRCHPMPIYIHTYNTHTRHASATSHHTYTENERTHTYAHTRMIGVGFDLRRRRNRSPFLRARVHPSTMTRAPCARVQTW